MNKKFWYVVLFSLVAMFFIFNNDDSKEVSSDYDSAFYVEAENNIFVKFAKILDDCCYYVVDIVLNGVETIVSSVTGN